MKHIDQKWKTYALCLILSDWDETPAPVLFDFLTDTDSDSLDDLFDEHCISVWQPFEDWAYVDLINLIVSMATQAQETAEAA
jgi:hypothetical protein